MFEAEFCPEAWQGDNAVTVDPQGPTTWDCSAFVEANRAYFDQLPDGLDVDDLLKDDPAAPEWVRKWSGPFSIHVTEPIGPSLFVLDVTADSGVPFRVLAIPCRTEGPNRHRAPAGRDHAIVEFYDRRYLIDGEHGQFTGGYYDVDTILGRDEYGRADGGLCLHGGVPDWTLDDASMDLVRSWLALLADGGRL